MKMQKAVRPLEIKSIEKTGEFKGFASVFGNEDSYRDIVVAGAFQKDLSSKMPQKIKMLWQHDTQKPIGVYNLIQEKEYGLEVEGQLLIDDVQQAREAYALLKAGAIDGLSIGYETVDSHVSSDGKKYLTEIKLWEISVVTFPANNLAIINGIKDSSLIQTIRHFEKFLRDAGFSQKEAKTIAASGYKSLDSQRDADDEKNSALSAIKNLSNFLRNGVHNDHRSEASS